MRLLRGILCLLVAGLALSACTHNPVADTPPPPPPLVAPTRVLVLILPSLSPTALGTLKHVSELEQGSLSFSNAWVGDLAATPLVSLPVLNSGLLPKHLPWQDEVYRPSRAGFFTSVDRLAPEFPKMLQGTSSTALTSRLKGTVYAIAGTEALARALGSPGPTKILFPAESVVNEVIHAVQTPDWKGIFARFGGESPPGETEEIRLAKLDEGVGQVISALEHRGLLTSTLIVVTSDRGLTASTLAPPTRVPVATLLAQPEIANSLQDSWWRFWLKPADRVTVAKFSDWVRGFPEVAEVYTKQVTGTSVHYIRNFRNPRLKGDGLAWADANNSALVDSMACEKSPEAVALLLPSDAASGSGAQEAVQRIPLLLRSPTLRAGRSAAPVKLIDLNPMISRLLGLPQPEDLDGSSDALTPWLMSNS